MSTTPADHPKSPGVVPKRSGPPGQLAARHGHRQQRHGGAGREGGGEEHRSPAHAVGGSDHGDGRQDRPRAGHEQQAAGQPHDQAGRRPARLAGADPGERTLDQLAQAGHQKAEADDHEHRDPRVAEEVLGQVQRRQDLRSGQDQEAETDHQTSDHRHRAEPGGSGGTAVCQLAGTGDQHDGKDRQDAR